MANESKSKGIGVVGLLGVAFVVLKLCGVIHWSWWWVLAPFWVGIAIFFLFLLLLLLLGMFGGGVKVTHKPRDPLRWQKRLEEMQAEQKRKREQR